MHSKQSYKSKERASRSPSLGKVERQDSAVISGKHEINIEPAISEGEKEERKALQVRSRHLMTLKTDRHEEKMRELFDLYAQENESGKLKVERLPELFSDYEHLCGFILVTYREYLESATLRTSNDGVLDDFKVFAWRKLQAFKAALGPKSQSKGTTDFNEYGSRLDEKEARLREDESQEILGVDREDLTSSIGSSTLARTETDFE